MSELISGKEAAIAYLDGKEVLHVHHDFTDSHKWSDCKGMRIDDFKDDKWAFKIKPRTITINGVEVPAPFEPKDGDRYFYIANNNNGYMDSKIIDPEFYFYGAWRTKYEIKQVVAALRSVFNVK